MLLPIESHLINNTVIPMIDNGTAVRIDSACFRDGYEDEFVIEFWRLWGEVIRSCQNRRTTVTEYQFVRGEAKDRLARMS